MLPRNTRQRTIATATTSSDSCASDTSSHRTMRNVQYNKAEGSSISTWYFQNLCDQPVEYHNKLNATILSVLLLGNMVLSTSQLLPDDGPLSNDWFQAVLYAARTGYSMLNELEGGARPLTVDEAISFLEFKVNVKVVLLKTTTVQLCDSNYFNSLASNLASMLEGQAAVFSFAGYAVFFLASSSNILMVDFHARGHLGAAIVKGSSEHLGQFIRSIENVSNIKDDSYGIFALFRI